ncbi:MAG: glycerol-3-phosphate dehydrogenase/oxidase [bacterium]|nr:glycerol-3-phosphate dehydrogenase/oxidase [bacterium]
MSAGTFSRPEALARLEEGHFDVCVIGGGITGVGAALDAASRGLRVALVERGDFAEGTSSRSSKLVHGGLRYLRQGEVRLVAGALIERQRLRGNAPHLVKDLPFVIPLFGHGGKLRRGLTRAIGGALWAYDLCGGALIGKLHRRLSKEQVLAAFPTLKPDQVVGGYQYYDCQTDDARLVLSVIRTAALEYDAVAANRVSATKVVRDSHGRVSAVLAQTADGERLEISCRAVINATGVWAADLGDIGIRPAKGVHLAFHRSLLGIDRGSILPSPVRGRSIFVIPLGEACYVGTTDTDYSGSLDDPRCNADDAAELLGALRSATSLEVSEADVIGAWAGLRPLVAGTASARTADLSRRHHVAEADGVVTVTGGKLTTYRQMAADAVDVVVGLLSGGDHRRRRSKTKRLRLRGAASPQEVQDGLESKGLPAAVARHLAERYGTEADELADLAADEPNLGLPLTEGLPYLRAEVVWAARAEMARTVDDVLSRRTQARHRHLAASMAIAEEAAALLGRELGWSPAEQQAEAAAYRELAAADLAGISSADPTKQPLNT